MKIRVVRLGAVRNPTPAAVPDELAVEEGTTAGDILPQAFQKESDDPAHYTLMIDGKAVPPDRRLKDGDTLFILRLLGGG